MTFDKPFTIQIQDENTELWSDWLKLHAYVNKTNGGSGLNAGADQARTSLTFEVRYISVLEAIRYSTQRYRIVYRGHYFKVTDFDDFKEQHQTIKLVGEHYEP